MLETGEDGIVGRYTGWIIRNRWLVIVVSIVGIAALSTGARHLRPQQNYRIFFGPNNPQLAAFDALEKVYTKIDNHLYVVHNPEGSIFTAAVLSAVRELTDAGWQIPHSTRVGYYASRTTERTGRPLQGRYARFPAGLRSMTNRLGHSGRPESKSG